MSINLLSSLVTHTVSNIKCKISFPQRFKLLQLLSYKHTVYNHIQCGQLPGKRSWCCLHVIGQTWWMLMEGWNWHRGRRRGAATLNHRDTTRMLCQSIVSAMHAVESNLIGWSWLWRNAINQPRWIPPGDWETLGWLQLRFHSVVSTYKYHQQKEANNTFVSI